MIESSVLEKIFRKHGLAEQYREQEPAFVWDRVVGEKIARLAQPIWVHDGVLFVAVPNHIVQHEFSLMREDFKRKLNTALGAERVKEIRFRVESFPMPRQIIELAQIELMPAEEQEIEQLVSPVKEDKLRTSLARCIKTAKRLEKARQELGWKPCPQCGVLCEQGFCPLCTKEPL
jgi:predicted nucleic acid-binding Zn ribbon protein